MVRHIADGLRTTIDVPERRRVTILFSDVAGFTELADRLDPESLSEVINGYLGAMADVIAEHGAR